MTIVAVPEPGPSIPRRGGPVRAALGRLVLRLVGWRIEGNLPDLPKLVVIAAPHSSGWDFVIGIALVFAMRLDIRFLGKAELFRGPLAPLFRWLGGIPVDRRRPDGVVEDAVARFQASPRLLLVIAPEGTRRPVEHWKTGFYRIAFAAGVPIVTGFIDNGRKRVGFGGALQPTGDSDGDIARLRDFYRGIRRR
ncbi:MAG TPA: lysophospholipid acyltransferase family protein [Gemmatimonadales bacterium]|nr:lysophospholipid acyltransferase family protein [Gemmatimonadales bacterium]